jgi:hypothetical protein
VAAKLWKTLSPGNFSRIEKRLNKVQARVARWFVSKPKIPIWEKFSGYQNGKCRYILRPFGIFYGYFVTIRVHIVFIWYIFSCFGIMHQKNLATLFDPSKTVSFLQFSQITLRSRKLIKMIIYVYVPMQVSALSVRCLTICIYMYLHIHILSYIDVPTYTVWQFGSNKHCTFVFEIVSLFTQWIVNKLLLCLVLHISMSILSENKWIKLLNNLLC